MTDELIGENIITVVLIMKIAKASSKSVIFHPGFSDTSIY